MIAAAHSDHTILGDQLLCDGGGLLGQSFGVGDDHVELATENAALGIDVFFRDQHRVAHRLAADNGAGGGEGCDPAELDRAIGGGCRTRTNPQRSD